MNATDQVLAVGSWSSGSTRVEDWAEAALDMAQSVGYEGAECSELAEWLAMPHIADDDWTPEDALDELVMALGDYAPIYCYVGAHPGDGADFGVWISEDALGEAIRTSTRVEDHGNGGGRYVNAEDGVIIDVSDHGNVSVYELTAGRSLLSIV